MLAFAGEPINLQWSYNFTNNPEVVSIRLYIGGASRTYTNAVTLGRTNRAAVISLWAGRTYYFAVTAVASNGVESAFSNEVSATVRPNPPQTEKNSVTIFWGPFDVHQSSNLVNWTTSTVPGFIVFTQGTQQFFFVTRAGDTNKVPVTIQLTP